MLGLSENPAALQAHIATLPESIALKAADIMRLSTGCGPNGGVLKMEQFNNALTESER